MSLQLSFPFKSIGRNHSHMVVRRGKYASLIKTAECRKFERAMQAYITAYYRKDIVDFIKSYDERYQYIEAKLFIGRPDFWAKSGPRKGRISKTSQDNDSHKVAADVVFSALGIDDSQAVVTYQSRFPSKEHFFVWEIDTKPLHLIPKEGWELKDFLESRE